MTFRRQGQALIRRMAWVALTVLLLTSATCAGDDDVTASDVKQWIIEHAEAWLDGFTSEPNAISCPYSPAGIRTSDGRVRACTFFDPQDNFYIRAQNLTDVPVTIWGDPASNAFTIFPGATLNIRIFNPEFDQYFYYDADTAAGLSAAVADEVQDYVDQYRSAGMSWVDCVTDPDLDCLLDTIVDALPSTFTAFDRTIPLKIFAEGLNLAYQNFDVLDALFDDATASGPGTMTIIRL